MAQLRGRLREPVRIPGRDPGQIEPRVVLERDRVVLAPFAEADDDDFVDPAHRFFRSHSTHFSIV